MAVYDGFFDAVLDEESGEADRAYGSGDFTGYFEKIIGSGVCVHNDPDSFRVRMAGGAAVVSPGYLFIQGYWLRNDADYTIPLTGDATLAIAAHLNLGRRMIELEAVSVAQAYPDSLVLALVNPAAGTAEDTRYNTGLCGVIDSAGELSKKVTWAINYIDNEIENKLAAAEADIAEQSKRLDAKIAEVQAQVDKIEPPPVGTIQFSASQNVGPEWLPCNGDFVSESQYPELVAALGKLIPSGDKFQLISDGEIGPQISNGVVYGGRLWVYSYAGKKLYGVDLEGKEAVKEIAVSSEDPDFENFSPPAKSRPIALSVTKPGAGGAASLFLSQICRDGSLNVNNAGTWGQSILIFSASFTGEEDQIAMEHPFAGLQVASGASTRVYGNGCIPYVMSCVENGAETYYFAISDTKGVKWKRGDGSASSFSIASNSNEAPDVIENQRISFDPKNNGEAVYVSYSTNHTGTKYTYVESSPTGVFSRGGAVFRNTNIGLTVPGPVNVAGRDKMLFEFTPVRVCAAPLSEEQDIFSAPVTGVSLPASARVFPDAAAYLWGKDIFLIFVGTGIIFSRTLEEGSFGYLDTTGVLGTVTQFGWLGYSRDEGTLCLLGQDTANRVKAAKIVLNTLYDYANDGAWLPVIASDGVPAYIKAYDPDAAGVDKIPMTVTIDQPSGFFDSRAELLFNGEALIPGTYTRQVVENGTFTVGCRMTGNPGNNSTTVSLNGNRVLEINSGEAYIGLTKTASFKVSDYISAGITLKGGAS